MKIALAQLNLQVGNFSENTKKIIAYIVKAKENKAELIVFSELSICGYPPLDLLYSEAFITACEKNTLEIARQCQNIAAIIGSPTRNLNKPGKALYNSALLLSEGKVIAKRHKTLLPNYGIFDEKRYFEANKSFELVVYNKLKIALTICEDIWNLAANNEAKGLYGLKPMSELAKLEPDILINIAASPFAQGQKEARLAVVKKNAQTYHLPVLYVNQVGGGAGVLFDGGSFARNKSGDNICALPFFTESLQYVNQVNRDLIPEKKLEQRTCSENILPVSAAITTSFPEKEALLCDALVMGIRDYCAKSGFEKVVLGLSGGIDSALVFALAFLALEKKNVLPVLLPSGFSSDHSISDAMAMINKIDSEHEKIEIQPICDTFNNSLKNAFTGFLPDVTEENLQARTRGVLLMALSNKKHYLLLGTSNKSEMAVGYGTLYGDMCGALAVIGDVYKTEVYALCKYINSKYNQIIPDNILNKAPSAELRADQKDTDTLPDYAILDKILFQYIELRKDLPEIVSLGYDKALVQKIIGLVHKNEHKRYQAAPVLRVSARAFGTDWRMPLASSDAFRYFL